jgi:hypothetical protein
MDPNIPEWLTEEIKMSQPDIKQSLQQSDESQNNSNKDTAVAKTNNSEPAWLFENSHNSVTVSNNDLSYNNSENSKLLLKNAKKKQNSNRVIYNEELEEKCCCCSPEFLYPILWYFWLFRFLCIISLVSCMGANLFMIIKKDGFVRGSILHFYGFLFCAIGIFTEMVQYNFVYRSSLIFLTYLMYKYQL